MSLKELKEQAFKLSPGDRLELVSAIIKSLQDTPNSQQDRADAIQQMRGLLKTEQPAPTDQEVEVMLKERVEKYL